MIAATATARVKEGGREVSNGKRLIRRAIWFLLAVGACLPASVATARPPEPSGRGLISVSRADAPGQEGANTRDEKKENKNKNDNKARRKRDSEQSGRKPTPRPTPKPPNPPAPPVPDDPDIFKNIQLSIVISSDYGAPARPVKVALWSRELDLPATPQVPKDQSQQDGAYIIKLPDGLNVKKDYWVTVTSADGQLSGEAVVSRPVVDNDELPIRVALYPAVTFDVSTAREGDVSPGEVTLSVFEKNQKSSLSIPHALKPGGRASFVKGLNPEGEYILVTSDGRRFPVKRDKIEDDMLRIDLSPDDQLAETIIKVRTDAEGKPIRDAEVTLVFDDSQTNSKVTNEEGVADFKADARRVRAVKVEAEGYESFSCGGDNEVTCPMPDESGALVIPLEDSSSPGLLGLLLQWGAVVVFPLAAIALIILGVAIFRILLNPTTPPADVPRAVTMPKTTSGATAFAGVGTSLQTAAPETQEPNPALVQHETTLISNADDAAAQPDGSPAVQAFSVSSALSVEMAKEVYKRWVRREKLTRDPVKLDLVLSNLTDDESQLLKETNDPGSKFILFSDGENGGWLFPNPAPSVFQTEVEQTWRLVFKDLSKEEFGRKKERLNPVEARRADGAQGRGMWTAEPKPYEFS